MAISNETQNRMRLLEVELAEKLRGVFVCPELEVVAIAQGDDSILRVAAVHINKESKKATELSSSYMDMGVFVWMDHSAARRKLYRDLRIKVRSRTHVLVQLASVPK
jgi:hypothetical protein